jgi:hypothetical protein
MRQFDQTALPQPVRAVAQKMAPPQCRRPIRGLQFGDHFQHPPDTLQPHPEGVAGLDLQPGEKPP